MKCMIVNGFKLAELLKEINVSKSEFVNAMSTDEPYAEVQDGETAFIQEQKFYITSDFFQRHVCLGLEESRKFLDIVGYSDAVKILDWEAMGLDRDKTIKQTEDPNGSVGELFERYLNAIVNAYKSKAVQTPVRCF